MKYISSAPGKVIVLGEYAVLAGKPAIAFAVNRRVIAEASFIEGNNCYLETVMPNLDNNSFKLGDRSGLALVDLVISQFWQSKKQAWSGKIDSSELYFHENKLGLVSN